MKNAIPLLGGFNDGKYVKLKGLQTLKLAYPTYCGNKLSISAETEFGYETYTLKSLFIGNMRIRVYAIKGLTTEKIFQKLVSGYRRSKKRS